MRKSIILLGILTITSIWKISNAQDKFATYDNSYARRTFDIKLSENDNEEFLVYIDALSLDNLYKTGGLLIQEEELNGFIESLNQAKLKYVEWEKTAKENNVTELDKRMEISSVVSGYFLFGREWHMCFGINLTFDYKIIENNGTVKYLLIVRTGKMKSSRSKYTVVDGVVLVFSSVDEIDKFVNALSIDKIEEFLDKPKAEDLFK